MARRVSKPKVAGLVLVVLLILIVVVALPKLFVKSSVNSSSSVDTKVKSSRASFDINRDFFFPISKDKDAKKIKVVIQKAQLQDEIIIQGQKVTAVAGRTFLTLDLKIVNDMDKALSMNTKDYVRLSVNKNDKELLAPDIHNDPVDIQAISTKYTRIGFPVNTTDHDFVLFVGEITGDKQKVELRFI